MGLGARRVREGPFPSARNAADLVKAARFFRDGSEEAAGVRAAACSLGGLPSPPVHDDAAAATLAT